MAFTTFYNQPPAKGTGAKAVLPNVACLAGAGLVLAGSWLFWPPLAPMLGGVLLTAFGVFLHRASPPAAPKQEHPRTRQDVG